MASQEPKPPFNDATTFKSTMPNHEYNFLNDWVKKKSFTNYIENNCSNILIVNNNTSSTDKKPTFLGTISKYKYEKLEKHRFSTNDFLNSTISPIRTSDNSNMLSYSGSLDQSVPIKSIGGNRHFLIKFSKLLLKKPCKLEDQAEIWLVVSGAADLLHKSVFEVYYAELCSYYDDHLNIQSQNRMMSTIPQTVVSIVDGHRCQDDNIKNLCCSKFVNVKYFEKCHNPFCYSQKSINNNFNVNKENEEGKVEVDKNFVCCIRGYATVKKMTAVLKTLHPELSELSLLEVICWITLHFFKCEIDLFAFLLSLLRSKHYDYFDQTISQTIISSLTLRHLLQDYIKRNYSAYQLTNNPNFIIYRNLSKIKLPNDEFEYVNSNKPLDLNCREFLIPKWKVFLLTNMSLDLQVRIVNYFIINGPGILFQAFIFYFSRIHEYLEEYNIDLLKSTHDLHHSFYQNIIGRIIESSSNTDIFDQIVKVPVKTNRINFLHRVYCSYYNCSHIDADLIKFLLKYLKRSHFSRINSKTTQLNLRSRIQSVNSLATSTPDIKVEEIYGGVGGSQIISKTESKPTSDTSSYLGDDQLCPPTDLLKYNEWKELIHWVPYRLHLFKTTCIFSTQKHGYNLKTLYKHCENSYPIIILIHTKNNELFGAYISSKLSTRFTNRGFFGNGETFVFQLRPVPKRYIWIGLVRDKITPEISISKEHGHCRSRSSGFVLESAKKVCLASNSTLDLSAKQQNIATQASVVNQRSNILERLKNRFKSAFRFKIPSSRLAKKSNISDPSPAFISMEMNRTDSNSGGDAVGALTTYPSTTLSDFNNPRIRNSIDQKLILNDLFVSCDNSTIMIGGGREGFAIQLDANLLNGNSRTCDTFDNPSFVDGEDGDFVCTRVDVIGFVESSFNATD